MLDEECDEPEEKLTKRQLRNAEKIEPSLPGQKAGIPNQYIANINIVFSLLHYNVRNVISL